MLYKYQKFLESFQITKNVSINQAMVDFCESLQKCKERYQEELNQFDNYYSCSAQDNKKDMLPDNDFIVVDEFMASNGWDIETSKKLYIEYDKLNLQYGFIDKILFDSISTCAPTDYYLFKITNGEFPLQGYKWDGMPEEEYLIRFSYGWHKSNYGQLCIKQNLGTIEKFLKKCNLSLPYYIMSKLNKINVDCYKNYTFIKSEINDHFLLQDNTYYIDVEGFYLNIIKLENKTITQDEFSYWLSKTCEEMGAKSTLVTKDDLRVTF